MSGRRVIEIWIPDDPACAKRTVPLAYSALDKFAEQGWVAVVLADLGRNVAVHYLRYCKHILCERVDGEGRWGAMAAADGKFYKVYVRPSPLEQDEVATMRRLEREASLNL